MLRVWVVVAVVVVVGCGFRVSPAGSVDARGSGDAFDADDDALTIDASVDAEIDGPSTPTDIDGDGVLDTSDNCPTIGNSDQHNEDGDPRGDACDACPYLANAVLDVDGDGDGIGDACDPHPAATDLVVLFDPFKAAGPLSTTWVHVAGTASWTISGDALQVSAGTGTEIMRYPTTARPHTIDMSITVQAATGGTTVQNFVTGITDVANSASQYFGCGYRFDSPAFREFFDYDSSGAPQFTSLGSVTSNPPTVPGTYRIRLQADPSNQSCVLTGVGMTAGSSAIGNASVGIRARNVTIAISYVAIYRSP